jgi:prolipoprotein diacylglyceryltransferase
MIPYFVQPSLSLGPISIHAFGVLVAVGILIGMRLIRRRAAAWGMDPFVAERLTIWILLGGFAGAHLIDRLVYYPADALANPWSLLRFWEGLSSFGGFLGAIAGAALFVRLQRMGSQKWLYLDVVAYAFPTSWFFGRTGCFLAYDHPGSATNILLPALQRRRCPPQSGAGRGALHSAGRTPVSLAGPAWSTRARILRGLAGGALCSGALSARLSAHCRRPLLSLHARPVRSRRHLRRGRADPDYARSSKASASTCGV